MPTIKVKKEDASWEYIYSGLGGSPSVTVDPGLSIEGAAADSKAVGDMLNNKQNVITGEPGQFVVIGEDGLITTETFLIAEEVVF